MLDTEKKLLKNLIHLFIKTENLELEPKDIEKIISGKMNEYKDFMVRSLLSLDLSNYVNDSYDKKVGDNISGFVVIGNDSDLNIFEINQNYKTFDDLKNDIFEKYKNSKVDDIDYLIIQLNSRDENFFKSHVQVAYYNFSYKENIDKDDYIEKISYVFTEKGSDLKKYLGIDYLRALQILFTWKNLNYITLVELFLSSQLGIEVKIKGFRRPPKKKKTGDDNSIYYLVDIISLQDYMDDIYKTVEEQLNGDVEKLLEKNVRTYISFKKNEPAQAIVRTLFNYSENKNFFLYNTGIVSVASSYIDKYDGDTDKYILKFKDFSIINGGQTTVTLYKIYELLKKDLIIGNNGAERNDILQYVFSIYFEGKKGLINELIKNKDKNITNIRSLIENYFIFMKEFLFGSENIILNKDDISVVNKVIDKIKLKKEIKGKGNIPYYDGFIKEIINGIFINEFLKLYGKELKEELGKRFRNNDILFKVFIGLDNNLLNKVAKYVNLQNRVLEKDLIASRPEVKLLGEYINKLYKFNLYNNKDTTKSFDLFNQSVFVYLSTVESSEGGFLGDKNFGPSYAKNYKGQLYLQQNIYSKIWGFDIENYDIEKRVFFYLIESKILYLNEERLLRKFSSKYIDYIKSGSDLYILFVLAFLLKDKLDKIDFKNLIEMIGKAKPFKDSDDILNIKIVSDKTIGDYLKESISKLGNILEEENLLEKAKKDKLYRLSQFDKKIAQYFGYLEDNEEEIIDDDFNWEDLF